jgi:CNT family concentrative nucleoside transporter
MLLRLLSAFGIVAMLGMAYALCPRERRAHVAWRTVGFGVGLLLLLALLFLRTPLSAFFGVANTAVERLLAFSRDGASFVFGRLATDPQSFGFIFAVQVLPTILFFSALMSVLYHLRVMPFLVERGGRFLSRVLGTSGAESFSTMADVFVGQTEAPLVIRPYLPRLTLSELHACLVAGFATTAGGVLAAYVVMLSDKVPGIAGHLIACSVMAAPASLAVAKLIMPEVDQAETAGHTPGTLPRASENLLDAIATGTIDGVKLAVNVGAMLIVFLALTGMVNAGLGWAGAQFGLDLSLQRVFGWVFAPLAFLMGVPFHEVTKVGSLLGEKTVLNEFVAYSRLSSELARDPAWLSERGRLIVAYALCGFANFGSIGIQIGGYSGLAPERRADVSKLALRAMIGGLLTTCIVASAAGIML